MFLRKTFMAKSKQEVKRPGPEEPEEKKTISFRFSDTKYYPALDRFSRKDKRKWSDFARAKVETALDELLSSEN
jgi:hypothetical protein